MIVKKRFPKDPDLAGVEKALKSAAISVHTLARQTKTPCYVMKDGKTLDIAGRQKASAHKEKQ